MKFDLHIHTVYSDDSHVSIEETLKAAEAKGMNGLAITDHNTLSGYRKAKSMDTSLIIVPGIEISTPEGHVLALGIEEEVGRQPSIKEAVKSVRYQGGLAVAPHPHRSWSGIGEDNLLNNDWDAVEGKNGRSWGGKNRKAKKLAEKEGYPVTAGSDAHRSKSIGKTYTILQDVQDWRDVIEEIKNGRSKVGGENRSFIQTFFYVRRALFGWMKRGFKRV